MCTVRAKAAVVVLVFMSNTITSSLHAFSTTNESLCDGWNNAADVIKQEIKAALSRLQQSFPSNES